MLRQLLRRYREARRAHPRLAKCVWAAVVYGSILLAEGALGGIDSWADYLWPLLFVIVFLVTASLFRRDREEQ